jgi:hypothetical protein
MQSEPSFLREHEKFWAFVLLICVVVGIVAIALLLDSHSTDPAKDIILAAKLRILDAALGGTLTIAGMAAQALFRISATEKASADALNTIATNVSTTGSPSGAGSLPDRVEEGARAGTKAGVADALGGSGDQEEDAAPR